MSVRLTCVLSILREGQPFRFIFSIRSHHFSNEAIPSAACYENEADDSIKYC